MRYLGILKYLFINDIRRIYDELLAIIKNKSMLIVYGGMTYLGLCSLAVTLMSLKLITFKIYSLFNIIIFLSICFESLNVKKINYFSDINNFGRMLIYPASLTWMCFLNIIKYILNKIIIIYILFTMLFISSILAGFSLVFIMKSVISFHIYLFCSILVYLFVSILHILKIKRIKKFIKIKQIISLILNALLGYLISFILININEIKKINTKNFYILFKNILTLTPFLQDFSNKNFVIGVCIDIILIALLLLINIFMLKILINNYILKYSIILDTKNNNYIQKYIKNISIVIKKDLNKLFRKYYIFEDYIFDNIREFIFLNIFILSCFVNSYKYLTNTNFICFLIIITYFLYIKNFLTTYKVTAIDSDGRFVIYYYLSDYKIKKLINIKSTIEIILNGIPIMITLLLPIVLYSIIYKTIITGVLLLLAIVVFIISLAFSNVYSMACNPKYNWSTEDEIQNNFLSSIYTLIFNYMTTTLMMMIIIINVSWSKLQFIKNEFYKSIILIMFILFGSILNIFINKILYNKLGRPYGEYQL